MVYLWPILTAPEWFKALGRANLQLGIDGVGIDTTLTFNEGLFSSYKSKGQKREDQIQGSSGETCPKHA